MSERETLEKAFQEYDTAAYAGNFTPHFRTILNAARKHLETLPKPMWRVTGLRDDGTKAQTIAYWDRDKALDGARSYVDTGYRDVNLVKIEVPT